MKMSTVALIISNESGEPQLKATLYDAHEIEYLEVSLKNGEKDPLKQIYEHRERQIKQEDEFGNYVEDLLSQPFIKAEIRQHGIQWLRSKIKIDNFQKAEEDAVKIISGYAYRVYQDDRSKVDFFLASPTSQVRVRIFSLPNSMAEDKLA